MSWRLVQTNKPIKAINNKKTQCDIALGFLLRINKLVIFILIKKLFKEP